MAASEVLVGPVYQPEGEENSHLLESSLPPHSLWSIFSVSTLKNTQKESTRRSEQKGISEFYIPRFNDEFTTVTWRTLSPLIFSALFPQSL